MAGQTLALFQVPAASRLEPGDDPDKCKLTPVEDLKVLKLVAEVEPYHSCFLLNCYLVIHFNNGSR